jgi:hypothetical protein
MIKRLSKTEEYSSWHLINPQIESLIKEKTDLNYRRKKFGKTFQNIHN